VTVRIAIDLNVYSGTRARVSDADGPIKAGDKVLAVEPFDGIVADAAVAGIDEEHQLVFLVVDWSTFRDDPEADDDRGCE
jgi:hypothetical protein